MLGNLFALKGRTEYSEKTINILRLIRSENVGPKTFIELVKHFGNACDALDHIAEFSIRGGRNKPIKICSRESAEKEIEKLNKNKAKLVTYADFEYSKLLLETHGFPPIMSYKGDISLLSANKLAAIVGARNSSINARAFAGRVARDLVKEDFVCVSGLASGIDTAVHEASGKQTIAVIAGGIDHIYPPENKKLFEKIISESLLLAELPVGSKPLAQHFPQRNRIISGISQATIVIEAGLKSGSLITANFALEQNREVFACPGFPLDPRCMGSNKLLKQGATLIESAEDVINSMQFTVKQDKKIPSAKEQNFSSDFSPSGSANIDVTEQDRQNFMHYLSATPASLEQIHAESGLPMPIIYIICLELELAGKIARHIGNKISLIY